MIWNMSLPEGLLRSNPSRIGQCEVIRTDILLRGRSSELGEKRFRFRLVALPGLVCNSQGFQFGAHGGEHATVGAGGQTRE